MQYTNASAMSAKIEVWIRKANALGFTCMVVQEDETTASFDVESFSMRGAQREMTSAFLRDGYKPVGRWEDTADESECVRNFVRPMTVIEKGMAVVEEVLRTKGDTPIAALRSDA